MDGWHWVYYILRCRKRDGADNPNTTLLNGNQKLINLNGLLLVGSRYGTDNDPSKRAREANRIFPRLKGGMDSQLVEDIREGNWNETQ